MSSLAAMAAVTAALLGAPGDAALEGRTIAIDPWTCAPVLETESNR